MKAIDADVSYDCCRNFRTACLALLLVLISSSGRAQSTTQSTQTSNQPATTQSPADLNAADVNSLTSYIHNAWPTLTRSMTDCKSLADTKLKQQPILYVPRDIPVPAEVRQLEKACGVRVQQLPRPIAQIAEVKPEELERHGLLYLPNRYVVPGGRFNEMYGWDSYFIIRGLLRDGELDLARGMIENFFFEIDHYGAVLNANRTYYFTRSQPPFLTSMITSYYDMAKAKGHEDQQWLAKAYSYAQRDYELWSREPHLAGDTGLSRYFDFGDGPVPEMGDDPHYYSQVAGYLILHPEDKQYGYLVPDNNPSSPPPKANTFGPSFSLQICGDTKSTDPAAQPCVTAQKMHFLQDYYKGDRAMRESGFDISFRFGPFSGSTHHFAPVCLNSLLYKEESDLEKIATTLGKADDASRWHERARTRQTAVNTYFWNQRKGMFFDYDFTQERQSTYNYATTFYPLWAGLASPEQARAVAANIGIFEKPGGIAMSDRVTGVQWDLPYGWAPLQLIPVEGLRRYGFNDAADRLSREFISTVIENFKRDATIREKYNVVTRSSETAVSAGYSANVVGFGWTNGVTLELLQGLSGGRADRRDAAPDTIQAAIK